MRIAAWSVRGVGMLLALAAPGAMGQSVAGAKTDPVAVTQGEVSFQFERAGVAVPRYTVTIREDGTGRYVADEAVTPPSQTSAAVRYAGGKHVDHPITVRPATAAKIFRMARSVDGFNVACASKAKNIADTGKKTLSYAGADGRGSCEYNYSDNKSVAALTEMFLAIAFTIEEGRRLEFLHRYDRLGLDAEVASLAQEAEQGRAMELGTIAPALESIAGDMALIQRVRLRAAKMLEQAKD